MVKEINENWANEILRGSGNMKQDSESTTKPVEFVRNNSGFKRELAFKVVAPNSKENKIFCHIVGTHWLTDENNNSVRFVCPEQTLHLKHEGLTCPVCEAKRNLIAQGFKEEELTTQGKYGPIPVFDPKITSNMKIVVLSSDTVETWDKAHISVLSQNSDFLTKWILRQYKRDDVPNFLAWDKSNCIVFNRQSDNGKWERSISFKCFEPSVETIEALKKENEELTMFDLWKMPVDEDFLNISKVANTLADGFRKAKNAMTAGVTSVQDSISDDFPF